MSGTCSGFGFFAVISLKVVRCTGDPELVSFDSPNVNTELRFYTGTCLQCWKFSLIR
jgi:hypothetical protein